MAYEEARDELVRRIERREDVSERTLDAIRAVPRHEFVPEDQRDRAYGDHPVPIGHGQTVSAPHMVAIMVDLLAVDEGDHVYEVGTGSGYHAAVVAEIVGGENVYSVEYVEPLAEDARERFDRLGYDVHVRVGDGREGWAAGAPYDAAYLTCGAPEGVPDPIIEQTRAGGTIVAPVDGHLGQDLLRLTVTEEGVEREQHGRVQFVPMQGEEAGE
ncbi:protein-L-isoaspartate(D-aspartate) O-methyltransferase [Haloparvum sp. PAK95]|uniref:protein-L-isoaspartate(D-aspartate) O-methyltransferase n=1 Tax=Haloparvum sp. PAK95 TaxID=3418962 RepID=UPI003D2F1846